LRRHVIPFTVVFTLLTVLLLANFAAGQWPQLNARGASAGALVEALLLAVPSIIALSVPMAIFIAVSWVYSRLGMEGILTAARGDSQGIRRPGGPGPGVAAGLAALVFVSNDQLLPRANGRLATLLADSPVQQTDRARTVGELRQAARSAIAEGRPSAAVRAI